MFYPKEQCDVGAVFLKSAVVCNIHTTVFAKTN